MIKWRMQFRHGETLALKSQNSWNISPTLIKHVKLCPDFEPLLSTAQEKNCTPHLHPWFCHEEKLQQKVKNLENTELLLSNRNQL